MRDTQQLRLAVIGGGISGLAAAHCLNEILPSARIDLFESQSRLGGILNTEHRDGFLIERGADNFITTVPWGIDFCRRVGCEQDLVQTHPDHRRAFVVRKGRLHPIPAGFVVMAPSRILPIVTTPILSPYGKMRLAGECLVPPRASDDDESLASFVTRRFGRETYERLVQPLVAGIYTADPHKLSVAATMPRFLEMEREHGSLMRAMWRQRRNQRGSADGQSSGARYSQFVAPRAGMSAWIETIEQSLRSTTIHLNATVGRMTRLDSGGWQLEVGGATSRCMSFDGVILASPAHHSSRLLQDIDPHLSHDLNAIQYGSCAIVTLGFRRNQIGHPLDGFGFVVPRIERRQILSASFSSVKYAGRAPKDHALLRVFIGGACQPELLDEDDDRLVDIATQELTELLHIDGRPLLRVVSRRLNAMPQYHVGHVSRAERIAARAKRLPSLALATNALHGVGIPHCIHTAELAAHEIASELSQQGDLQATTA